MCLYGDCQSFLAIRILVLTSCLMCVIAPPEMDLFPLCACMNRKWLWDCLGSGRTALGSLSQPQTNRMGVCIGQVECGGE